MSYVQVERIYDQLFSERIYSPKLPSVFQIATAKTDPKRKSAASGEDRPSERKADRTGVGDCAASQIWLHVAK